MRLLLLFLPSFLAWSQINGTIVDQTSGLPQVGARVRIKGHSMEAISAADGSFTLADSAAFPFHVVAALHPYFTRSIVVASAGQMQNMNFQLVPVPLASNQPGDPLHPPEDCQPCHGDAVTQWTGSPMQKTGLNRWVWDLWDGSGTAGGAAGFVYTRDSIHRFAKPNSECSACHSPVHWLTDKVNAGMGDDIDNPTADMARGVQCEVCHRSAFVDPSKPHFPGVMPESFSFFRNQNVNVEWGLRPDVTFTGGSGGIMQPAYNPQLSARLCSACHQDANDHDDDFDFEDAGSVPHETTFSEWQSYLAAAGSAGKSCIECHMALTPADSFCMFENTDRSGTVRSHDIRGTTPSFLNQALNLSVTRTNTLNELVLDVNLLNDGAGHSVPSGVGVRNVLLLVQVTDGNDLVLNQTSGHQLDAAAGVGDPQQGYFAGLPGKAFYLNLTDGSQDRVFYTESTAILADNRIKAGEQYQGQFRFAAPGPGENAQLHVSVKVLYRRAFRDVIDVKGWTTTGHGEALADLQPPHYGHLMESYQEDFDWCGDRDLNGDNAVDLVDLGILRAQWLSGPPPFGEGSTVSLRHLTALVNCLP